MTDADRFEAFVREYQDMVFAVALRLLANRSDAEDAAQTVFLKAYERFDAVVGNPGAAGWLKTVVTNVCLNHLSRYRSRWRLFSELGDAAGRSPVIDQARAAGPPVLERLGHEQERQRLERALLALPDRQRVPLVLFHFEEHSYQEVATRLGVSLAKIKTDIHRGREALRVALMVEHDA